MKEKKIRIVIADDHQLIREAWKLLLEQEEKFTLIDECTNGEQVIESARKNSPDIILMDINMQPMDGFEATKEILKTHPQIKIIAMSMKNLLSYARKMFKLGAMGYIIKGSRKEEVIEGILKVYQGEKFICSELRDKFKEE